MNSAITNPAPLNLADIEGVPATTNQLKALRFKGALTQDEAQTVWREIDALRATFGEEVDLRVVTEARLLAELREARAALATITSRTMEPGEAESIARATLARVTDR